MDSNGGMAVVHADPVAFARLQWDNWSPEGWYDESAFIAK
jgi:hypothetical protein